MTGSCCGSLAAGDAVRQELVEREEFNAQHGDCKILVRNGERLDEPLLVKPAAKLDETPSIGGGMGGFCRHFRASALLFWTPLPPEVFLH
jgi:hypothetical protein